MRNKKILFVSGGETITKMFIEVIKEINDPDYETVVIHRDFFYEENSGVILRNSGITAKGLKTYNTFDARQIVESERPNAIVVGHDGTPIERSFILASKLLGIPSLLLQDGIVNLPQIKSTREFIYKFVLLLPYLLRRRRIIVQSYLFLIRTCGIKKFLGVFPLLKKSHNYGLKECSTVAVMSPHAKKFFVKLGFNADDVIITGQPRFDTLFHPKLTKHEVYEKININQHKHIALLATPVFYDSEHGVEKRKKFVEAVANAFASFSEFVLVIKVHPGWAEPTEVYKGILKEAQCQKARVVKHFDVPSLINACTVFLSHYSTMAMEALIARKPVIIINFFGEPEYYPFVSSHAALGVDKANDLPLAVKSILCDEEIKREIEACGDRFVYEHAYKSDGKASKRVATLIKQIARA